MGYTRKRYRPRHPWYYIRGEGVLTPRQMMKNVKKVGYKGYPIDHIENADMKDEPQGSEVLRA